MRATSFRDRKSGDDDDGDGENEDDGGPDTPGRKIRKIEARIPVAVTRRFVRQARDL